MVSGCNGGGSTGSGTETITYTISVAVSEDDVIGIAVSCRMIMYFPGNDTANGTEMWRTDGTDAGTIMLQGSVLDQVLPQRSQY